MPRPSMLALGCVALLTGCSYEDMVNSAIGPIDISFPPDATLPPPLEGYDAAALGGGRLAFLRLGGGGVTLYVINATVGNSAAYAMHPLSMDPALSPDGLRIAFSSYAGGQTAYDISARLLTGADSQRVSTLATQDKAPTWSPDGTSVYFFSAGPPATVYRQSVPAITPDPQVAVTPAQLAPACQEETRVAVSRSGHVAIACRDGIRVAEADGSLRLVMARPAGASLHAPAWSPDERWIAFAEVGEAPAGTATVRHAIRVVRPDGSGLRTVVSTNTPPMFDTIATNDVSLAWSPNGSRIAFNTATGPRASHVFVVRVDGTGFTRITTQPDAHDHSLTWVP